MNDGARTSVAFGPWSPGLTDSAERRCQLRCLAGLAAAYCGSGHELVDELRKAETDEAAAERALKIIDAMPSLTQRRLISTFAAIMHPRRVP